MKSERAWPRARALWLIVLMSTPIITVGFITIVVIVVFKLSNLCVAPGWATHSLAVRVWANHLTS